jgi:hypothetical protein
MEKEALAKLLELEEDELVLWSGKPAPFKILDKYYKPVFIRNYLITIIIVASIFTMALIRNASGSGINITALAVMCCIPLVIVPLGLSQFNNYGKKCKYFLTNKNIITLWESRTLKLPISNIDKFDSVPQEEGTITIRIGKAADLPIRKNRDYALRCLSGNTTEEKDKGCLLYNLSEEDAATVLELIDRYRVVA